MTANGELISRQSPFQGSVWLRDSVKAALRPACWHTACCMQGTLKWLAEPPDWEFLFRGTCGSAEKILAFMELYTDSADNSLRFGEGLKWRNA